MPLRHDAYSGALAIGSTPSFVSAAGREDARGCMFCNGGLDPEHSHDGDGVAFSEHIAINDDCRDQWRIWKQAIVDEWYGD